MTEINESVNELVDPLCRSSSSVLYHSSGSGLVDGPLDPRSRVCGSVVRLRSGRRSCSGVGNHPSSPLSGQQDGTTKDSG